MPGGTSRALRMIPAMVDIAKDVLDLAPDALFFNYGNPMAANCWAFDKATGRPHVGLCHSVQGTSEMLARWIGVPYEQVVYHCAGINHQAFFLSFRRGDEDLYPRLWQAIEDPAIYGSEPVRIDQGGSLQFRAMGGLKDFGPVPAEVWTMAGPRGQAFGTMALSDEAKREQAAHIAKVLTRPVMRDGARIPTPTHAKTGRE